GHKQQVTIERSYFLAVTVISMFPGPTNAATTTVVRVGRGSVKNSLYTAFIRWNLLASVKYTCTLTTSAGDIPAAFRIAPIFSRLCFTSDSKSVGIFPAESSPP